MTWENEHKRILTAYIKMDQDFQRKAHYFSYTDRYHIIRLHDRYWTTLRMLDQHGIHSLENLRILDVGCGDGAQLRQFVQWGAKPENLFGVDLRPEVVETARSLHPNIEVRCQSAVTLPWPEASFDLVCQHTVFSSILDDAMKSQVARDMVRLAKPGGAILWYDFMYNNPANPNVRGVGAREIQALFPGLTIHLQRITLAPPIARRIPAALLPALYPLLAGLPFLRSHYLGLLTRA